MLERFAYTNACELTCNETSNARAHHLGGLHVRVLPGAVTVWSCSLGQLFQAVVECRLHVLTLG